MAYKIVVVRSHKNKGKLTYTGGTKDVTCDCWWDPDDQISAGTYTKCSKTHLTNKTNSKGNPREGIYFPSVAGRNGIFIHYWPGEQADLSKWSDGCVCVLEKDMLEIWDDISPANGKNVTIEVRDGVKTPSCLVPRSRYELQCTR